MKFQDGVADFQGLFASMRLGLRAAAAIIAALAAASLPAPAQAPPVACSYALSSAGQAFGPQGGAGSVTLTTGAGCPWSVSLPPPWVTLTSASLGSGPATITFSLLPNAGPDLSGSFTIASEPFIVEEESSSIVGLSFIGSMPHLAAEGGWNTTFTFVNKGSQAATARTSFYAPNGLFAANAGALTLPILLPQDTSLSGPLIGYSIDQTIAPNASFIMQATGPPNVPYLEGSAQLLATPLPGESVDGFAIFHYGPTEQEAVVPLETRSAASYLLAFDNTNSVLTGVALENVSDVSLASPTNIPVVIRLDGGTSYAGNIPLPGLGHTSFVLSQMFPVTANSRGTIEFDAPPSGQISALGIRYTLPGTLTTIPTLANVTNTGGLIAHLASGNGWQTTFVLVNTGLTPANVQLSFFGDNGAPLPMPLTFPQGNNAPTTVSTLNQSVPAESTLWIESSGALGTPLLGGSAQLTTSGNVGGYVVFRYNPNGQEAVVPLETRNAGAYLIPFDNTLGTVTGIALSTTAATSVNVPVVLRDDTGALLGNAAIPLNANGHMAFGLAAQYAQTTGIRGTVEFDAPPGAAISVLGIRTPPALTFTTLPPLAK